MPKEAEIETQFMRMDKDGSGQLDMTELKDLLHLLGVTPIQPGDGRPSAKQDDRVKPSLVRRASFTTTQANNLPAMQIKAYDRHLAAVVKQFDVSGDGLLNLSEFKLMVRAVVRQQMTLKPVTRMQGKWAKPPADVAEPARTERLLAHPFTILRSCGSDCQDSMSLNMMGKTSGGQFIGICFAWASMIVQASVWLACHVHAMAMCMGICFAWALTIVQASVWRPQEPSKGAGQPRNAHRHVAECLDCGSAVRPRVQCVCLPPAGNCVAVRCGGRLATHLLLISAFLCFRCSPQVLCGFISGLGPYVLKGSSAAFAQVLTVALIKLSWAGVLIGYQPCVCLLVNNVIAGQVCRSHWPAHLREDTRDRRAACCEAQRRWSGGPGKLRDKAPHAPFMPPPLPSPILCSQFISEGLAAVLVLIAAQPSTASDTADMLRLASFFMLLFPVFIPVMQKAYDGLFVNVRTMHPWSCLPRCSCECLDVDLN